MAAVAVQGVQGVPEVVVPALGQAVGHLVAAITVPIMTDGEDIIPTIQPIVDLERRVVGMQELYLRYSLLRYICV